MHLTNLELIKDGETIRLITFKDGLNLVTNERRSGRSGNSVGKSTLSRVVDFLLLDSVESIYIDEEFGHPNTEIESLFEQHEVIANLTFIGSDERTHQVSRKFAVNGAEDKFVVDGASVDKDKYETSIQKLFFNVTTRRPSVRAIAPKFIRNDSHRMLNTTKFLDVRQSKKDYSELYLYLFGFQNTDLLTQKRDVSNLVSRRRRNNTSLNALVREQKPKVEIKQRQRDIAELEKDFLNFDYSPEYSNPVERLSGIQNKEDRFTRSLLGVKRKISNIENTIQMLGDSGPNGHLSEELKSIYGFASASIDGVLQEFSEVLDFHSILVDRKKEYLGEGLPELLEEKEEIEAELSSAHKEKLKVFSDMRSAESIANITTKLQSLGALRASLGKLEGLLEQQNLAAEDLKLAEDDLESILQEITAEMDSVYSFSETFNGCIKELTKSIHDQEYEAKFIFNESSGNCVIDIVGGPSNPEGGKKKAEVIAFDFSYIYGVWEHDTNRPKFVFHDSIEDIDQRQIDVIFKEARKLPGQQIISMLSDNLSEEMYNNYRDDAILILSESERFFKV